MSQCLLTLQLWSTANSLNHAHELIRRERQDTKHQVAIPLAEITSKRVNNLYDLMDSAYDAPGIHSHSRSLGHIPIIDIHPRGTAGKQVLAAENKARATINMKPGN